MKKRNLSTSERAYYELMEYDRKKAKKHGIMADLTLALITLVIVGAFVSFLFADKIIMWMMQ